MTAIETSLSFALATNETLSKRLVEVEQRARRTEAELINYCINCINCINLLSGYVWLRNSWIKPSNASSKIGWSLVGQRSLVCCDRAGAMTPFGCCAP